MKRISIFLGSFVILGSVVSYVALAQVGVPIIPVSIIPIETGAPTTPPIRICPLERDLMPGARGDEVKALQSILSQDPSIYPQGIVSGYYGSLTQEAVKRLQQQVGLPVSGIVDNDTRDILFPCMKLRITSPNGGEVWRVGETRQITWEVEAPLYMMQQQPTSEGKLQPLRGAPAANIASTNVVRPFFQHLSIDLLRFDIPQIMIYPTPAYYHIGSAPLYGERSYSWTIPQTIPESKAYKIRISLWKDVPQPFLCKDRPCPMAPFPIMWRETLWDESDGMFAILGGPRESPSPTILPTPEPDRGRLRELRAQLQQALENIQKAISLLDELLGIARPTR